MTCVCFVLCLRDRVLSSQKRFGPINVSAVHQYAALAMVQHSCRWVTTGLTVQSAAFLIGLQSVGCIKVNRKRSRRFRPDSVRPSASVPVLGIVAVVVLIATVWCFWTSKVFLRFLSVRRIHYTKGLTVAAAADAPSRSRCINSFLVGKLLFSLRVSAGRGHIWYAVHSLFLFPRSAVCVRTRVRVCVCVPA